MKDGDKILSDPGGADAVAPVPEDQIEATIESAEECRTHLLKLTKPIQSIQKSK